MSDTARDPVDVAVTDWLARYAPTGPVVVGVSGGADSLALALAVRQRAGDRAVAVTVDHGLQPGSTDRAQRTAELLRHSGFQTVLLRTVDVGAAGGPEAAARTARLAALRSVAGECGLATPILLAHTMDDQAETVLLGLGRGSGPRSIAGMRAWRAPFGRPLLGVRRSDTEASCRAAGLEFWTDPHNADPRYTRVRLRHEVLPLLEQVLGGGVTAALARTAALIDDDLTALDELAASLHAGLCNPAPTVAGLAPLAAALRRRVLRRWLQDNKIGELTADHYARIDDVLILRSVPGAQVRLPGGIDLTVKNGVLQLVPVAR
ncbi:MAG: tRNA lysidine(34) synthetase TilS [Nakamurella sp.]